jgi:hypothetical protein
VLVEKRFIDTGQTVDLHVRATNPTNVGPEGNPLASIDLIVEFDHRTQVSR